MPDPIEELSNFDPGVPVNPLPAPEVRRLGERRRRRNAALVAGAVAAVLAAAVPIAVFAGGDEDGRPEPADELTTDALLTADELPARERLAEWREVPSEGEVLACAPEPISALGAASSVRRDFAAEIAGSRAEGPPSSMVRTQVLQFDHKGSALAAYETAAGWIGDCPGAENANRDSAQQAMEVEGGVGQWRTRIFTAPEYCGGTDCDAALFDRMGVAQFDDRLVLVSLAEVGGPLEPEGLDASMERLFRAAITKAGGEIDLPAEPEPEALDFPLENGLIGGSEFSVVGPGPGVEGVTFPEFFCGNALWPPANPVGRLAVKVTGPEYGQWRELVTFATADEAVIVIAGLESAVADGCYVAGDDPASDLAFVSHQVDSGYDDATFSYTYREGLGGVVYQFVRVGHAVLATAQSGEWAPETTPEGARQLNGENSQLTPLMCEYTRAGC